MGLFDGFFKGAGTGLVSGGLSLLGGVLGNATSASSVKNQQQFQMDMSNTSYQRAVKDMEAAGLNPMLAYGNGGASVPSGASYVASNVMAPAVNSALETKRLRSDLDTAEEQRYKMAIESGTIAQQGVQASEAAKLNTALRVKAAADAAASVASAKQTAAATELMNTNLPRARKSAAFDAGSGGDWTVPIEKVMGSIGALLGGANSAKTLITK